MRRVTGVPLSRPYSEWDDGTEEIGEFSQLYNRWKDRPHPQARRAAERLSRDPVYADLLGSLTTH